MLIGSFVVLAAGILAYLSASYRPDWTPLMLSQARPFGFVKPMAVTGAVLVALGAMGY